MKIVNLKKVTTDKNINYFVVIGLTKNKYEEIKDVNQIINIAIESAKSLIINQKH